MKKGGSNKGEVREDVVGYDIFVLLPIMNASMIEGVSGFYSHAGLLGLAYSDMLDTT